jgi:hypothetical protein
MKSNFPRQSYADLPKKRETARYANESKCCSDILKKS